MFIAIISIAGGTVIIACGTFTLYQNAVLHEQLRLETAKSLARQSDGEEDFERLLTLVRKHYPRGFDPLLAFGIVLALFGSVLLGGAVIWLTRLSA